MSGKHGKRTAMAVVKVESRDDQVTPEASPEFVETPYVKDLSRRGLAYLEVGYPVHFAGPAGTGKTTLAFHVAAPFRLPQTETHRQLHPLGLEDGGVHEPHVDGQSPDPGVQRGLHPDLR
jgi:MoxR-like ATPase